MNDENERRIVRISPLEGKRWKTVNGAVVRAVAKQDTKEYVIAPESALVRFRDFSSLDRFTKALFEAGIRNYQTYPDRAYAVLVEEIRKELG